MDYLGYKSMDDPLFRVDKTLMRVRDYVVDVMPSISSQQQQRFQDATETLLEKLDEGNGMAYVSSWGEANPGGGKDRVQYYIERSKDNVSSARDSLKIIIDVLGLKVN